MAIGDLDGRYEKLLVSPNTLKSSIIDLINGEIGKGSRGRIILKLNSITDLDIIEKLKEASCAGVRIDMIVRGICCILPGVEEKTENIRVKSLVGRYLEHSRIYCFGEGAEEKMFISSADFMTRNTERRVEVACPIEDERTKAKIHRIIDACLSDNVKGRILQADSFYTEVPCREGEKRTDCQQLLMNRAIEDAQQSAERKQNQ